MQENKSPSKFSVRAFATNEEIWNKILDTLTDIPYRGEQVQYNKATFVVQSVKNNRINKVKILKNK